MVKNLPAIQETQVWSLGQEDPLVKGMATHSSILTWRIPWTEEPDGLQSTGGKRDGHDWVTTLSNLKYEASTLKLDFEKSAILTSLRFGVGIIFETMALIINQFRARQVFRIWRAPGLLHKGTRAVHCVSRNKLTSPRRLTILTLVLISATNRDLEF